MTAAFALRFGAAYLRNRTRNGGYDLGTLRGWVIALFLFGTVPALAANPNPMSASRAQQLALEIHAHHEVDNLIHMASVAQPGELEHQALFRAAYYGNTSLTAVSSFLQLAIIYQHMASEDDKAYVARVASIDLDAAKQYLDIGESGINSMLMGLKSPAAVAEAERLRDLLRKLRQELDPCHY